MTRTWWWRALSQQALMAHLMRSGITRSPGACTGRAVSAIRSVTSGSLAISLLWDHSRGSALAGFSGSSLTGRERKVAEQVGDALRLRLTLVVMNLIQERGAESAPPGEDATPPGHQAF